MKTYRTYLNAGEEAWPLEFHQDSDLKTVVYDAYGNEELVGEIVYSAVDELKYRGYSEDEVFRFVTWGD